MTRTAMTPNRVRVSRHDLFPLSRRGRWWWMVALIGWAHACAAAVELTFVAADGAVSDRFANDGREIRLENTEGATVPLEGRWEIRGELKSAAAKIGWNPAVSIGRRTRWRHTSGIPMQALVTLTAGAPGGWSLEQLRGA